MTIPTTSVAWVKFTSAIPRYGTLVLLLFFAAQRYFVRGIVMTGLKG